MALVDGAGAPRQEQRGDIRARPAAPPATAVGAAEPILCVPDDGFAAYMAECGGSIAISTYQAGRLFLIGWRDEQVTILARGFGKPMGLDYDAQAQRLALATQHHLWIFDNAPALAQLQGRDALFLPRCTFPADGLYLHDVGFAGPDLCVINTRWSTLNWLRESGEPARRWRAPWVSQDAPEDRCHLNGLAIADGRARFVTALGETDVREGWREGRRAGGIVADVESGRVLARGLSMPHSPRWRDGALWLLNSGDGALVHVGDGEVRSICHVQGFARGLGFDRHYALIGLSGIRESNVFGGLPVHQRWPKLLCGVAVVDMRRGVQIGFLHFTSGCHEIYDVHFLPGMRNVNVMPLHQAGPAYPALGPMK
ncbi:MAG: TIGR03032 family protein [Nevskia sp.]|nr:TIGR03032 family protein [Nevskia sp.]